MARQPIRTRSAGSARDLVRELGSDAWASAVGTVPVGSITVAKLRWMADYEPSNAERTRAVCLPHDWLTWRLGGAGRLQQLRTDRSDASGTGYWSPAGEIYRTDLLKHAFGRTPDTPVVLGPADTAGFMPTGVAPAARMGDNAAAAMGVGAHPGDVIVSIGTSGVVSSITASPVSDASGTVAGFASGTGDFLPLVCTMNAARVLDATAAMLGVDHQPSRTWRSQRRLVPVASCLCRTWRVNGPRTCRTLVVPCTA